MWVAGVDGCARGWVLALARPDFSEPVRVRVVGAFTDVVGAPERPGVIAVDMPIGLPDRIVGPGRAAEQQVRPLLGARRSSVFSIPSREAVHAPDYAKACRIALATSAPPRKVSRQGFGLFRKIREIDALVAEDRTLGSRIYETHPEVAFWTLNGEQPLCEPKKIKGRAHAPGLALRRRLLIDAGLPPAVVDGKAPAGAGADDYLDALAGLAVALAIAEGRGRPFPDPPGRDSLGLPIAIWTFHPPPRTAA